MEGDLVGIASVHGETKVSCCALEKHNTARGDLQAGTDLLRVHVYVSGNQVQLETGLVAERGPWTGVEVENEVTQRSAVVCRRETGRWLVVAGVRNGI